jgi:TetR/AcrR family transcriptional regulator, regulator of autoinduction and epiphytic fitness
VSIVSIVRLTVNCYGDVVSTIEAAETDGRSARRARNRDAVVDALLAFFDEGELAPGLDAVAQRAEVSPRSLFRYFDDADDLTRTAISRQQERLAPLLHAPVPHRATTAERVQAAVDDRVALIEAMGAVGQVARLRAHANRAVAVEVARMRRVMRERMALALGADIPAAVRTEVVAALDVACSFEAYRLLRDDLGLDAAGASGVLRRTAAALVADAVRMRT